MKFKHLLFLVSIFLIINSCGDKDEKPHEIDPAFINHISGFTAGVISNQSKIRIQLTDVIQSVKAGEEVQEELFDFSPKIEGKTVWIDKRTIEFQPANSIEPGTIFDVEFALGKIKEVPAKLKTFEFRFQTIAQGIYIVFEEMQAYDDDHLEWQKLSGTYQVNDFADPDAIRKSFNATQNGEELKVNWEFNSNNFIHRFEIDSVSRGEEESEVVLSWDGEEIGADVEDEEEIKIPALGDFTVMSVTVDQVPKQTIIVNFSDPVSRTQNLNGLIYTNRGDQFSFRKDRNTVYLYPNGSISGERKLTVSNKVKNTSDYPLKESFVKDIAFNNTKPQVAFIGNGNILPSNDGFKIPIKAVNLSGVNVKVIKIYENNITQFFQENRIDGTRDLRRVGRVIAKKSVSLIGDKSINYSVWNNFNLDITDMVKVEQGAIYRIVLNFDRSQSLYPCEEFAGEIQPYQLTERDQEYFDEPYAYYYDYYDVNNSYYEGYEYNHRQNPCKPAFYNESRNLAFKNVLASDIGIIAKGGNGDVFKIAVTNLKTTKPLASSKIELYNYQNQVVGTTETDAEGLATIKLKGKPYLLVASYENQKGYLRIDDGSALSMSMFDVSGSRNTKGIKGFIYGERGVWRPGDSLFLNFILEDKNHVLPPDHPVVFELYTPDNQLYTRMVKNTSLNGFYDLRTATSSSSPTGNWQATVKVGNSSFTKSLKIEAVKPNRLKINIDFEDDILSKNNTDGILSAKWLHGADANGLRATMEMNLTGGTTNFEGFGDYKFDDPSKSFYTEEEMIFDGNLNSLGVTDISPKISVGKGAPGMLTASLKTRVFEKGGDFSVDRFKVKYSPYDSYVGVKIPQGKGWNNALFSDEPNLLPIVTLDEKGNPVDRKDLKIEIFDVYWRWWWQRGSGDDLARYVNNKSSYLIKSETISTKEGKALFELNFKEHKWGRKLIRITDPVSGHSTGATFYLTYKGWWNDSGNNPGGAEMLNFAPDKKKYNVGDEVRLELPKIKEGRVLVSLESGSKIISTFWKDASELDGGISFKTTEDMAPNVYAHLTLIQPHATTANDLPIRMYGVQNISVEDPGTHLHPVLDMPKELKPEQKVNLSVSEKDGKPMTYTVAMVDEGLLDLTRFQTPDPWPHFYKREALGIKTWDLYRYVMGAFSGEISGLLALGGDGNLKAGEGTKANRFEPVVRFLGPFELEAGEKNDHSFMMPNYVGSVRTMIIAGENGAYGSTDKTTPVKKPLMVLATLPRVVSPSEKLKLPVTVFAMDKKIKNVKIKIETNEFFSLAESSRTISFDKVGDQIEFFELEVQERIGVGKVKVIVEGSGESASNEIEIGIRLPNPEIDKTISDVAEIGKSWAMDYEPIGIEGTNRGAIEVSTIPPLNLEKRLNYLIQYPHGCIEQTTSSVFPQLFLSDLVKLDTDRKNQIQSNINQGLNRLRNFQLSSGAFAYWPGNDYPSIWGTSYAGHFIVEAKNKGYVLPTGMLEQWIKFQTKVANEWSRPNPSYRAYYEVSGSELEQSYRLYTLALAGKPAMGAMNRMREQVSISETSKWRLAAAYALANKTDVAKQLIDGASMENDEEAYYYTYGSPIRDRAMILETLDLLNDKVKGKRVLDEIAKALSSGRWMSTQTTAYSLTAIAKFVKSKGGEGKLKYNLVINGKTTSVETDNSIQLTELPMKKGKVEVKNTSGRILFVNLSLSGVPLEGSQVDKASRIGMQIKYLNLDGTALNPDRIEQGSDFMAEVVITHPGGIERDYNELALNQLFPSGWEIRNLRMDGTNSTLMKDVPEYQDIRDDRVYTYFDLDKNTTRTFRILLNAAYLGNFYLPAVECSAMYDNTIQAVKTGKWVEVVKSGE